MATKEVQDGLFELRCGACGAQELSLNLIAGHGIHAFCEGCMVVVNCLTPETVEAMIANPRCDNCGGGDTRLRPPEHGGH